MAACTPHLTVLTLETPAWMAGEPARRAMVWVGPPLFASVPRRLAIPAVAVPVQLVSSARLPPLTVR
jgi:hypothetical protein